MTERDILMLGKSRVYWVATPAQGTSHTAFLAKTTKELIVPKKEVIYIPKYPGDWVDHPGLYRAVNLSILIRSRTSGANIEVRKLRPGEQFFFIPEERALEILNGFASEIDILADLELQV